MIASASCRAAWLLLLALVGCGGPSRPLLLEPAPSATEALVRGDFDKEPGVIEVMPVRFDLDALKASSFDLSLGNRRLQVKKPVIKPLPIGSSVVGTIGRDGFVALVVANGEVSGTIDTGTETYGVRRAGSAHFLVRRGLAGAAPDHPPGPQPPTGQPVPVPGPPPPANKPTQIKVIVVYTTTVPDDIEARIYLAIEEANIANQRSELNIELELADVFEDPDYVEDPNFLDNLTRFVGTTDPYLNLVHSRRDTSHADLAILVLDGGANTYKGRSAQIMATQDQAFSIVDYRYLNAPYFTFEHEIGHLMGLDHNPGEESDRPWQDYGRGHVEANWRTIMAILCEDANCTRKANWSNPDVRIDGIETGVPRVSDSAQALRDSAPIVAAFRTEP